MSAQSQTPGANPLFPEPLHVGRPNVGDRTALLKRIEDMLDRRWFSNNGPLVQEFEKALADRLGVAHCIATCNGTVALELAARALEFTGEVIVPSYTFVATAHALYGQGITPVFADIDPETHNLDPASVERMITPATTGIVGVHVWGRPCPVDALQDVADRHGLQVMYDASHAFACSHQGRMIGHFGRCEVFSFHATKFFNTFEGGALATNDGDLAARLRLMKNFGFAGYDNVVALGSNGKMTEICAAMGLTGLEQLDTFVDVNRRNHDMYRSCFASVPGLRLLTYDARERCNYQYVVLEVQPPYRLSRDELVDRLHEQNVLARKYFWPGCHNMQPYRTHFPDAGRHLIQTKRVAERVVVLPTGTAVNEEQVRTIAEFIVSIGA